MNIAHTDTSGDGIQTSAMCASGYGPDGGESTSVEIYDGTSWVTTASLASGRQGLGAAGTTSDMVVFGGNTGPSTATEEFTPGSTSPNVKTITTS